MTVSAVFSGSKPVSPLTLEWLGDQTSLFDGQSSDNSDGLTTAIRQVCWEYRQSPYALHASIEARDEAHSGP